MANQITDNVLSISLIVIGIGLIVAYGMTRTKVASLSITTGKQLDNIFLAILSFGLVFVVTGLYSMFVCKSIDITNGLPTSLISLVLSMILLVFGILGYTNKDLKEVDGDTQPDIDNKKYIKNWFIGIISFGGLTLLLSVVAVLSRLRRKSEELNGASPPELSETLSPTEIAKAFGFEAASPELSENMSPQEISEAFGFSDLQF